MISKVYANALPAPERPVWPIPPRSCVCITTLPKKETAGVGGRRCAEGLVGMWFDYSDG